MRLELLKIRDRKFLLYGLIIISIIFPFVLYFLVQLHALKDNVPQGIFIPHAAWAILSYSGIYFCLPLFIIVFIGQELSNGHVNRVVFIKSKSYYFAAKLIYALLISFLFSIIGIFTLYLNVSLAPYEDLRAEPILYFDFFIQSFLTNIFLSLFLLTLTFFIKNPVITFVTYFVLEIIEKIIFAFADGLHQTELFYLPLHLIRLSYSKDGTGSMESYYQLFANFDLNLLIPVLFIIASVYMVYIHFLRSDLTPLSD